MTDETRSYWLDKEWLIANGLGGYASNSLACVPTRKYHGLLIAALPELGRMVMLNHLAEILILPDGQEIQIGGFEHTDGIINPEFLAYLEDFYLDKGLPVWKIHCKGIRYEKRIVLTHNQNTVHVIYTLLSKDEIVYFKVYPYVHFRSTSLPVNVPIEKPYKITIINNQYEIICDEIPSLKMYLEGENVKFTLEEQQARDIFFRKEAMRGYASLGEFWSPGYLTFSIAKNNPAAFLASTESWDEINALNSFEALRSEYARRESLLKKSPEEIRYNFGADLVLAADQFIIAPNSRIQDKTRANASGNEVRTIVAGYHWFTDWGRDTMISLEGLTLCTGRFDEARWILRTFAYYVRNGLIPNMFPEGENVGLYHTADASLWFFHALNRYLQKTNDRETLQFILPKLLEIYDYHIRGTSFGIRADPNDGLLIQGAEHVQLTWMDAKVEDWVVTPRRGKAVEINALWYNALRLLEKWLREENHEEKANQVKQNADKAYDFFNEKFWNEKKGSLFDVIEGENGGNDDALRPNQLFAISLDFPILKEKYWQSVFDISTKALLTPVGLRSLSADHPDYKSHYYGDLHARDAAYHQGTVWSWLIGPYIDTWLKVYPEEKPKIQQFLKGFQEHLKDAGMGHISEIFDSEPPYIARGCIAQAWSIAEVLRCILKTQ